MSDYQTTTIKPDWSDDMENTPLLNLDDQYISRYLHLTIRAARLFWGSADPEESATWPKNEMIERWLRGVEPSLSNTVAEKICTIIRPEWGK
jgi:hypothetical protein